MALLELKGGLIVREDAFQLYMALEDRGHHLRVQDGKLIVTNGRELKPADTAAIKAMRLHLIALAGYVVPE
jgi:hypothetical protein